MLKRGLIFLAVTALAVVAGWWVAKPNGATPSQGIAASGSPGGATNSSSGSDSSSTALINPSKVKSRVPDSGQKPTNAWVPPEGDPVTRYRQAKTKQERYDIISNFMALGHEKNPFMLVEALKDPDVSNRVYAVESASALTTEEATHVLRQAALNDEFDVRDMAWSILAPYPNESRNGVFAEVIANGSDTSLTEAFAEMERQPDISMFDTMVTLSPKANAARQARLLQAMQQWLEPGGGDVPQFKSVGEITAWWLKNRTNYDEFMLRIDQ